VARAIQITEKFAKDRGRQLLELIDGDLRDRKPHMAMLEKIRQYYYGDIDRDLRYPGQVNMHLPVITEKVEGMTLKVMNAMYGADPFVNVSRPMKDVDPEKTRKNEAYLNWKFAVSIPDSYRHIQRWVRGMLLDGPSVLMPYYSYETRKGIQTSFQKKYWLVGETDMLDTEVLAERLKLPIELLQQQFGKAVSVTSISLDGSDIPLETEFEGFEGLVATVNFIEDRVKYRDVKVYFYDTKRVDEVELCVHRTVVVRDGVVFENIEPEDIILPYRAMDPQTAERVGRQYWLTLHQIQEKVDSGEWNLSEADMNGLRAQGRSEKMEEHEENTELKNQRDLQVGEHDSNLSRVYQRPNGTFEPFVDNKVLIFEVYALDDADEDGEVEEVIYQIPAYTETIVRTDYLESVFPHGHRPFPTLHGVQIDNRWYTIPIAQWLLPINEECDVTLNQVHEAQEIINNPFFFYEPIAFGDNASLQNGVRPGMGVPVANAKGIFFPTFPQQPLANLQSVDSLLLFADRLTMSPQSAGSTQVRNAPRTARGTLALLSEGSAKIDSFIMEAQQSGWKELVYQVHSLCHHFGPDEEWFWVTGSEKPQKITRSDMEGKFEYIFRGNSTNTNQEVRRTIAIQRFQMLAGDPAYLANPAARRELILDFLRHNSEGVNIDKLDPGVPQSPGSHAPMSQESEIELMLAGQDMDILPTDDDAGHLQVLRRLVNSSVFESFQPWQVAFLSSHMNKHARQLVAKQAAGAMQSGMGGGQSNNVAAAGGELSQLEGGVA